MMIPTVNKTLLRLILLICLVCIQSGLIAQHSEKKHLLSLEGSLCKDKIDFVDHLGYNTNPTPVTNEHFQLNYAYKFHPNTIMEVGLGKKYYGSIIHIDPILLSVGFNQFYNLNQDKIRLFLRQRIYTCLNTSYRTDRPLIYHLDTFNAGDYEIQRRSSSNQDFRPVFFLYQVSPGLDFKIVPNHHVHLFFSYSFGFQTIARKTIEYTVLKNGATENGVATYSSKGNFSSLGISYQYHF